ncbi:MAG: pyridoxal phosphate-dependent aminotransferase [Bacilli bacterium]
MEQPLISSRADGYPPSPIRKLLPYAKAAEAAGRKVFYLNVGEPDLPTPSVFQEAMQSFKVPHLGYAPSQGHPQLLNAIQQYFAKDGYAFDVNELQVTQGATDAILFALFVIANPGDEILTPEPFYPNYLAFTRQLDVKLIGIPTFAKNGYALPSTDIIERRITARTRAILIANPRNPSGRVYRREELLNLITIAKKYNLWLIGDELYRKLTFGTQQAISFAAFPEVADRTIIVDSVSKRYSACGARIGALLSKNQDFMKRIHRLGQSRLGVSLLDQIGASALYQLPDGHIQWTRDQYFARIEAVIHALKTMPEIHYVRPEGAFYMMLEIPVKDAEHFAQWLIQDFSLDGKTVLVTPGKDFYVDPNRGKQEIRIAFVLQPEKMVQAMQTLLAGLKAYLSR